MMKKLVLIPTLMMSLWLVFAGVYRIVPCDTTSEGDESCQLPSDEE